MMRDPTRTVKLIRYVRQLYSHIKDLFYLLAKVFARVIRLTANYGTDVWW